ncbi:MAG: YeiH family protein [Planctomycetota bacterium]
MKSAILRALPGLTLALLVAAAAVASSRWAPSVGAVTIAILLGALVANVWTVPKRFAPGIQFCEKRILALAIALLGLRLDLGSLRALGLRGAILIVVCMTVLILLARGLARVLGIKPGLALLVGVGTAVCGSSAIAAAAPLVAEEREQVGIAVSVVNLLGTLGIFLLPPLVAGWGLTVAESALTIGGSLQAVGHVVAAGITVSDDVARLATAVKMGRVALLLPVLVLLGTFVRRPEPGLGEAGAKRTLLPGYLVAFCALAAVGNLDVVPASVLKPVATASKLLLAVAMAAIGLRIRIAVLFRQGPRALALGVLLFALALGLFLTMA